MLLQVTLDTYMVRGSRLSSCSHCSLSTICQEIMHRMFTSKVRKRQQSTMIISLKIEFCNLQNKHLKAILVTVTNMFVHKQTVRSFYGMQKFQSC